MCDSLTLNLLLYLLNLQIINLFSSLMNGCGAYGPPFTNDVNQNLSKDYKCLRKLCFNDTVSVSKKGYFHEKTNFHELTHCFGYICFVNIELYLNLVYII